MKNLNPLYLIEGINGLTKVGRKLGKKNPIGRLLRKAGAEKYFKENPEFVEGFPLSRDVGTMVRKLSTVSNLRKNAKRLESELELWNGVLEKARANSPLKDFLVVKNKVDNLRKEYDMVLSRLSEING